MKILEKLPEMDAEAIRALEANAERMRTAGSEDMRRAAKQILAPIEAERQQSIVSFVIQSESFGLASTKIRIKRDRTHASVFQSRS